MLPGLHDVHMHPMEASSTIGGSCVLDNEETNPESFVAALQACNLSPNSNGWIFASGHSIFTFFDPMPALTRYPYEILDQIYPNDPAVVFEETSHSVWVNSKAMTALGITSATVDPRGGHIVKDANNSNKPTGILLDNAGDTALAAALASNATTDAQNKAGLIDFGLPLLAKNGITSICEGRTYWKRGYQSIWQSIKNENKLTSRVVLAPWAYPDDDVNALITNLQGLYDEGDDMLRATQIKVYSDGIVINGTAAFHEPYIYSWDLPFSSGLFYNDQSRLTTLITALEQTGFDFNIHVIGDKGATDALNAIEAARNTNGNIGARHRLTHLEFVKSSDFPRFAALDVSADVQVAGAFANPSNWSANDFLVGAARTDSIIPIKALEEANARMVLSSDWDVSSVNPFVGMANAVMRAPQQISSVEAALQAYTINAAYVMRQEEKAGSLEVGKWADLIVVDRDIFTIPSNQIANTEVLMTYVGGEEVYRKSPPCQEDITITDDVVNGIYTGKQISISNNTIENGDASFIASNGISVDATTNINGVSRFIIEPCSQMMQKSANAELPALLTFEGLAQEGNIRLYWKYKEEVENLDLVIERSSNNKYYRSIATIHEASVYDEVGYVDQHPNEENYYRLKLTCKKGDVSYSESIFVRSEEKATFSANLSDHTTLYMSLLQISGGKKNKVHIDIFDANGNKRSSLKVKHKSSVSEHILNFRTFPEGVYKVRVRSRRNDFDKTLTLFISR